MVMSSGFVISASWPGDDKAFHALLLFPEPESQCSGLTWCRYFTANDTSTTGTLPLGLIQAAVAQANANPYDTFSIGIGAGPSLPQGEVRPEFYLHRIPTVPMDRSELLPHAPAARPVVRRRTLYEAEQTGSQCALSSP